MGLAKGILLKNILRGLPQKRQLSGGSVKLLVTNKTQGLKIVETVVNIYLVKKGKTEIYYNLDASVLVKGYENFFLYQGLFGGFFVYAPACPLS